MNIKKVVVTGESPYLFRHNFLFKAMSNYIDIQTLQRRDEWYDTKNVRRLLKYLYALRVLSISKADALFQKNQQEFIAKSQKVEQEIRQLAYTPDMVFHIFNTYSPFWNAYDIPYVVYLDYTMALAERNRLSWAYFMTRNDRDNWFKCEQQLFEKAQHLFTQSHCVKTSLLQDYDVKSERVTVVGASGNFEKPFEGKKIFGSKQVLFNGSDYKRKGGDLVLAAFKKVKKEIHRAKLVVIGKKLFVREDGVENPGQISPEELLNLFLKTDLVLAPAYSDPFPRFVIEAMNYGVPCIVSDNDGMPEIVEHNVSGIVIKQPTTELLADRIISLLSNPTQLASMSQAAQNKVKSDLNWDAVANKIFKVLST